jgi:hypothetical protein
MKVMPSLSGWLALPSTSFSETFAPMCLESAYLANTMSAYCRLRDSGLVSFQTLRRLLSISVSI